MSVTNHSIAMQPITENGFHALPLRYGTPSYSEEEIIARAFQITVTGNLGGGTLVVRLAAHSSHLSAPSRSITIPDLDAITELDEIIQLNEKAIYGKTQSGIVGGYWLELKGSTNPNVTVFVTDWGI